PPARPLIPPSTRATQRSRTSAICEKFSIVKVTFLITILAVFLAGCNRGSTNPNPQAAQEKLRTDLAPIQKRLPKLGHLQSAWWNSTPISLDSPLSPPGKSVYKVVGFALLEKRKADELSQRFQWQRTLP